MRFEDAAERHAAMDVVPVKSAHNQSDLSKLCGRGVAQEGTEIFEEAPGRGLHGFAAEEGKFADSTGDVAWACRPAIALDERTVRLG